MISLNETWEMIFSGPRSQKVARQLQRRSAAVLTGEARMIWKHEIPSRAREPWGRRGRRVSLTFRKVNVDASRSKRELSPGRQALAATKAVARSDATSMGQNGMSSSPFAAFVWLSRQRGIVRP